MASELLTKIVDDCLDLLKADPILASAVKYWSEDDAIEPDRFPAVIFVRSISVEVENKTMGYRVTETYPLTFGIVVKEFSSVRDANMKLDEIGQAVLNVFRRNVRINGSYSNSQITGWRYGDAAFANAGIVFFPAMMITLRVERDVVVNCN